MKKKNDICCYGCKYLWFNCCGGAECTKNYESFCPQNGFSMRKDVSELELKDIIRTADEIKDMGYTIENNIIESVDVVVDGHFGNAVCLRIMGKNLHILYGYNNTNNVGLLIKSFVELFDLEEDKGCSLSKLKKIPCRIVLKGGHLGTCVGFGHFMNDEFVLTDEFLKITE